MGEDQVTKFTEVQRRESGIEWADEVFVEPLCLFDLEAYSLWGSEFFFGKVYYKPYA
jgi:hypothetical protein